MSSNRKKNIHKNKNKSKSASSRPASASTSAVASSPPDSDVDEQLLASEEEERTEDFESASGSAEIEAKLQHSLQLEASQYSHQHPNDARLAARGNVKDVDISDLMMTTAEGHELLTLARLRLMHGRKYGLVGRNGIGKSTLLRRIANKQIGGFPSNLRCYMVDQEMEGTSKSLLQSVLDVDTERTRLLALEKTLVKSQSPESEAQLNDIYEQLTAMDSDSAESRAAEALDEVGFSPEQQKQTTQSLSGGFRMRVAIAAAIFMQPDVLLLDEPTNFLDLHGVLWLTDYIRSLDITCVIVSHDATFLTDVTDMTIHFHLNQLKYYHGNFETFVQTRADSNANIQRQQEALDAKRAHIRDSIEKMKAQAKRSNKSEMKLGGVASRQKKLGRMGFEHMPDGSKFQSQVHGRRIGCANDVAITTDRKRVAVSQIEPPDPGFKFVLPEPNMEKIPEGVALLSMKDVCFGYGLDEADMERLRDEAREDADRVRQCLANGEVPPPPSTNIHSDARLLLAQVEFTLRAGEKVGLVGANGQGKSTFLKLLCGKLTPSSGMVTRYEGVRIGLFTQHFVDQLDLRLTPVQHLLQVAPSVASEGGNTEQAARAVLGRFGLAGKLALAPIGTLSGGQKARLVFACITSQNPQILVLDEPSNHLDFVTIAALMDCIRTFAGAVLLVSHDQALMECCQQLWCVEERKLTKSSTKVNPNQLKAAALKAQKEITAAAIKAAKEKKSSSASSSSSSAARVAEKLTFPSRSVVRKLDMTFDDYREMVANEQ